MQYLALMFSRTFFFVNEDDNKDKWFELLVVIFIFAFFVKLEAISTL